MELFSGYHNNTNFKLKRGRLTKTCSNTIFWHMVDNCYSMITYVVYEKVNSEYKLWFSVRNYLINSIENTVVTCMSGSAIDHFHCTSFTLLDIIIIIYYVLQKTKSVWFSIYKFYTYFVFVFIFIIYFHINVCCRIKILIKKHLLIIAFS